MCLLHAARHGSYVASCVWRLCRVAHWLSSTMLRACCWLSAARCSPHTKCGSAGCFPLHLACARVLLHIVCCLFHVVCCMRCLVLPSSARCLLHAACCLVSCCLVACCQWSFPNSTLSLACCTFPVACCMLHVALHVVVVRCMLLEVWRMLPVARCRFAVRCVLPAACRMLSGSCLLHAACCLLHFPRCISHVVGCIFPDACCQLSVAHFPVAVGGTLSVGSCLRALSLLHVAHSPLHVV